MRRWGWVVCRCGSELGCEKSLPKFFSACFLAPRWAARETQGKLSACSRQSTVTTTPPPLNSCEQAEERRLRAEQRAARGQADTPTTDMYQDCMELLTVGGS